MLKTPEARRQCFVESRREGRKSAERSERCRPQPRADSVPAAPPEASRVLCVRDGILCRLSVRYVLQSGVRFSFLVPRFGFTVRPPAESAGKLVALCPRGASDSAVLRSRAGYAVLVLAGHIRTRFRQRTAHGRGPAPLSQKSHPL